jgi:biotin carboxyl carrier protein
MKKYKVTADGIEHHVEIEENHSGTYSVRIGEKIVSVTVEEAGNPKPGEAAELKDNSTGKGAGDIKAIAPPVTEEVQLTSPMPGNVVSVLVSKGDRVKYGDPVIILEAMKMKNEIPAPTDGIIREIRVNEGDTIDSEDIIAIIEGVKG